MPTYKKLYTDKQFIDALLYICNNIPTVYMPSGTLTPVTTANIKKFKSWCPNAWKDGKAEARIDSVVDKGTHLGADCNNLIKGLIWGCNVKLGLKAETTMKRNSNGLSDVGADELFNKYCTNPSSNMNDIEPVEVLHSDGHVGFYYGKINGVDYVIDATPSLNGVKLNPMSRQQWIQHGKLPWITYTGFAKKESLAQFISLVNLRCGIKRGDKNNFVKVVQERLIALGYSVGKCGADGDYGGDTDKAVKAFQKKNKITETGVGILTLYALCL